MALNAQSMTVVCLQAKVSDHTFLFGFLSAFDPVALATDFFYLVQSTFHSSERLVKACLCVGHFLACCSAFSDGELCCRFGFLIECFFFGSLH